MSHLAKNHAEVRLSSFQIIDDLFQRSHLFRELLLSDFQRFTRLVTGTEPKHPLPLPKPVAAKLKEKSLLAIRQWHDKYGEGYPRLKLSYNYLKSSKKVRKLLHILCMYKPMILIKTLFNRSILMSWLPNRKQFVDVSKRERHGTWP